MSVNFRPYNAVAYSYYSTWLAGIGVTTCSADTATAVGNSEHFIFHSSSGPLEHGRDKSGIHHTRLGEILTEVSQVNFLFTL
jgi:hypothetical protein